jgi:hypothetical protein
MSLKRRTAVLHVLLVLVVVCLLAAVGAGWKRRREAPSAGWTWDPGNSVALFVQD